MSQETPARPDLDGAGKHFLELLEGYVPVVLEVAHAASQQLETMAKKAMPPLIALAQLDWVTLKRRLDELPEKSKAAMILASSKGWFFGWNDGLHSLMALVETLGVTQSADVDEVMARYYRINLRPFTDELTRKYPVRAGAIQAAVSVVR